MIDDERLMAFADGMLSEEERRLVEAEVAADPTLAAKVERMRRVTAELRGAFAGQLDLDVPERLLAPLRADAAERPRTVIPFPTRVQRQAWMSAAAAACLAFAFFAGRTSAPDLLRMDSARGLVAEGALQQALNAQTSGNASNGVRVALSFADKSGGHCRVFEMQSSAGLACGQRGDWRVVALAETSAQHTGGVTQAGGALPQSILQAAEDRRAGDPLDAEGENAAIAAGWRSGAH